MKQGAISTPGTLNTIQLFLIVASLHAVTSCTVKPPAQAPFGTFSVKVTPYFGKDVRVMISSYERLADGKRGPNLWTGPVSADGITGFVLRVGPVYGVRAYADLDGDGRQSPTDPTGSVEGLHPVSGVNAELRPVILTLPGTGVAPEWPMKRRVSKTPSDLLDPAAIKKGMRELRENAPDLPIPPLPVPPLPVPPPPANP